MKLLQAPCKEYIEGILFLIYNSVYLYTFTVCRNDLFSTVLHQMLTGHNDLCAPDVTGDLSSKQGWL